MMRVGRISAANESAHGRRRERALCCCGGQRPDPRPPAPGFGPWLPGGDMGEEGLPERRHGACPQAAAWPKLAPLRTRADHPHHHHAATRQLQARRAFKQAALLALALLALLVVQRRAPQLLGNASSRPGNAADAADALPPPPPLSAAAARHPDAAELCSAVYRQRNAAAVQDGAAPAVLRLVSRRGLPAGGVPCCSCRARCPAHASLPPAPEAPAAPPPCRAAATASATAMRRRRSGWWTVTVSGSCRTCCNLCPAICFGCSRAARCGCWATGAGRSLQGRGNCSCTHQAPASAC